MENLAGSLEVLSADEIKKIHTGSLEILEDTGMEIPLDTLLDQLSDFGVKVDNQKKRAFFLADMVEKAIDLTPSTFSWYARKPQFNLTIGGNRVCCCITTAPSSVLDLDGVRRPATVEDALSISKLTNKLDYIDDGYCVVWPTDAIPGSEHAHIMYAQFSQSDKPARARLLGKTQAQDCIAMAQIVAGGEEQLKQKPLIMGLYSTFSPLSHTPEQLEGGLEMIKNNQLIVITPGIYGGAIGPITLAGLITQQTAEFLGLLTIAQLINPGAPIGYGNFSSVLDMKTGAGPMCTPEACLINCAVAQLARFYEVPSRGHAGTDSNTPDMQAGFENGIKIATACLAGCNIITHSAGFIDGGRAVSYENLFIDNEIVAYVQRILKGIRVNEEWLAIELIKRVGPRGSYMAESHTIDHMREDCFYPVLSNRKAYDEWKAEGAKTISQKANEKARDILKNYQPEPLDPAIDKELKQFIKKIEEQEKNRNT